MKLVVGLGNPGPRYADSRHNLGFMVVDELAGRWSADVTRFEKRYQALCGQAQRGGDTVLLLKPQTFMNLSGQSVAAAVRFYKLGPADIWIVLDDLDLPTGQLRVRGSGSAGGHNGLTDVLRHLGTRDIARLRLGIGKVHRDATVDHVLGRITPDERPLIEDAVRTAADATECWLTRGVEAAMNTYNRRRETDAQRRGQADASRTQGESS